MITTTSGKPKIGTKEAAEKIQKQIEARLALGDLGIMIPKEKAKPDPTLDQVPKDLAGTGANTLQGIDA